LSARRNPTGLLAVPGFVPLYASTWLWHLTRWGGLFTCSYLVTKLVDAPFLNQLVGASVFAPMLLGGIAAGVLSDRIERHRLIFATLWVLIPVTFLMFVLVQTNTVRVWMVFPFMLMVGMLGLVNMTSQRTLLYDTVGPAHAPRALTLDSVGMAVASMVGTLLGGTLIQAGGIGAAFALLCLALCGSAVLIRHVPRPVRQTSMPTLSIREHLDVGTALLRRSPPLRSMLGITVVMNVFYFSFVPLVPVMAKHLGANAFLTGVLASAAGVGQLVGGLVLASRGDHRRGRIFVGGSILCLCGLGVFAVVPFLGLAFIALLLAGAGQAGFGSMQSLLAIEAAGRAEQGAALGLLSTAVGALPLGMLYMGVSAQWLGAPLALFASSTGGMTILMVWLQRWPHVLQPSDATAFDAAA